MRRGFCVVPVTVLALASHATAQPPGSTAVETVASAQPAGIAFGDAAITGRVVDRVTARPLADVVMTLNTVDLKSSLVTVTDADGRYVFEGVAAGDYRVTARHPQYVVQTFGLSDLRMSPTTAEGLIKVGRKHVHRNIDFALGRGASVSGRITSHHGQPLQDAQVSLMSVSVTSGNRLIGSGGLTHTNANGEYTIANVPEGTYVVMALWIDRQRTSTGPPMPEFRPTFFPGTQMQRDATTLTIVPGDTHPDIDISLAPSDTVRISGHVVRGNSQSRLHAYLLSSGNAVRTVSVGDDGAFSVSQLKPGQYTLVARTDGDEGDPEAASMTLDVASELSGLLLGLSATGVIAGRVVTASGGAPPEGLYLAAVLARDGTEIDPLPRDRVEVAADGAFVFQKMFGERILRTGAGDAWAVDRILLGKSTVTSVTVQPGQHVEDVLVVLTRR
jgi:hypothetical protein